MVIIYIKDTWTFRNSNEYEYKFKGDYGAKGEKRQKKNKASPEQIAKQNQLNKEKKVRRLIKANFKENDLWITLKYKAYTRPDVDTVKKDTAAFLRKLRKEYKKREEQLKYVYRIEIGKRGGTHIHMIINRIKSDPNCDVIIKKCWTTHMMNFASIRETEGGFAKLASYLVKKPDEQQQRQLSLFDVEEQKQYLKYSSSRNLIKPIAKRKEYSRRTMRKIIENGPTPSEGYYIDKNSYVCGINRFTGMSYMRYIEYKLDDDSGG